MTRPQLSLITDLGNLSTFGREPGIQISRGTSTIPITGFVADAGTYSTPLDNIDRRFDPNYTSSPYSPNVVPGVEAVATAIWNAVTYPLFLGKCDGWPQSYPLNGKDQLVQFNATDAVKALNVNLTTTRPSEYTGQRIQGIVDDLGIAITTAIGHGDSLVGPLQHGSVSAWSVLSDMAQAEWGELYVDASGILTFRDRDTILSDTRSTVSQATFVQRDPADPVTGLQFSDVTMGSPPIVNDCTVSYDDKGHTVHASDATSIAQPWDLQTLALSIPFGDPSQARAYARWIVARYANPITTFSSITLMPANEPGATYDLWAQALGRELGDLITVVLDPLSDQYTLSGDPITRDCWIRGIVHDFPTSGPWSTTFYLQDASWVAGLFTLDVSELDSTDVLGM